MLTDEELQRLRAYSQPDPYTGVIAQEHKRIVGRLLDEIEVLRGTIEFAAENDHRQSETIAQLQGRLLRALSGEL